MIIPPTLQNNMRAVVVYTHKYISYIYIYIMSKLKINYALIKLYIYISYICTYNIYIYNMSK